MKNFDYSVARRVEEAQAVDGSNAMMIAGGTELLNWFRLGIAAADHVVDIGRLDGLGRIEQRGDRLRIGALATLNEVSIHPLIHAHATVLGEACLAAASPQIRNRATLGGNVLQKTRCAYFRAEAPLPWGCNKRVSGSGCAARHGLNERHAIFGWTDGCVAVQPSDPIVALAALDADVEVDGRRGRRRIAAADLHLTPSEAAAGLSKSEGEASAIETRLEPGDVIVGYDLPIRGVIRSAYVKVRERASYEYALVSAAASIELDEGRIAHARVALGSVALKPWRLAQAERALVGRPPTRDAVMPVITAALGEARPLEHNAYKIAMSAGAATRAITEAVR